MSTINIGIIGCGNISSTYFKNIPKFKHLSLVACADLDVERARIQADKFGVSKAYIVQEILADPEIDLIINLTIPAVHAKVCIQVLEAGKHVYVEKPLAVTREEAQEILDVANKHNLLVGNAPDTFLGGGIQTALDLIQNEEIGTPIGASAFMIGRGHENWHPDPAFYYKQGGGPMFDMGPYYLTALITLLGPINRISGSVRASYPDRTILSEPKAGEKVTVDIPTHIAGTIDFASGAIGSITTSFDAFGGSSLPPIEIYGSKGTILVPDPNTFGGSVQLRKVDETDFVDIPLTHQFTDDARGVGVADMAASLIKNRTHRANGQLGFHVLEAMHGFHDASDSGKYYEMTSTCETPSPFPKDNHFEA